MSGIKRMVLAPEPDSDPFACSCTGTPALPAAAPFDMSALAASIRQQLGGGQEVCSYPDGVMSFASEPGAPKTFVRVE